MPYFLLCLLLCGSPDSSRLSRTLDSMLSQEIQGNVPGMAVLVVRQGQILYKKAFGSANIELGTPLSPDMAFKVGSISKQFTAVGILHLVEQGRIRLTDSIQQYLKDYPWKGKKITIENLLTHTSGIVDFMSLDDPDPYAERREFKPEQIIHYFANEPLQFDPGTKYAYSNSNYTLLGYIVQRVTGIPFHTYMRDSILTPAGLTHSGYAEEQTVLPGRVEGYTHDRGYYENADFQSISLAFGCGDLLSTPEGLYLWNKALLEGKILRKETLQKAWTPFRLPDGQSTHYGYAWFIDSTMGPLCIHHEGQINGFIAEEKYFPAEDLYVCILTNLKSGEDTTSFSTRRFQLMQDIAVAALGPVGVSLPDSLLDRYVGAYRSVENTRLTMTIYKEQGKLFADLSNHTGRHMLLVPEKNTRFYIPDIMKIRTTVEFTIKEGRVVGMTATQERPYAFVRLP